MGTLIWTQGITLIGFFLGEVLPHWAVFVLVFGLVTLSVVPHLLRWYTDRRKTLR